MREREHWKYRINQRGRDRRRLRSRFKATVRQIYSLPTPVARRSKVSFADSRSPALLSLSLFIFFSSLSLEAVVGLRMEKNKGFWENMRCCRLEMGKWECWERQGEGKLGLRYFGWAAFSNLGIFVAVNFKDLEIFLVNFTLHSCILI